MNDAPQATVVWDGATAAELAARCGVPRIELFDVTDSALDVLHALAGQGAPAGTVVVADAQRAGRGSHGRVWSSEAGMGVWCAVLERTVDPEALGVLSLRIGLEVAERLDALAGAPVGLKWPNDLILDDAPRSTHHAPRKLGGILVETRWSGQSVSWVAVGVGVNVARPLAQTFAAGMPRGTARVDVLAAVVAGVRAAAAGTGRLSPGELERYRARDAIRGKRIVEPVEGSVTGISMMGELVVECRGGTKRFRTGTIRMAEGV